MAGALAQGQGRRDDAVRLVRAEISPLPVNDGEREKQSCYFAFRKSPTSSSTNSLSSALLGSRLDENGRLLSFPTMMWVASTRSTFSMVKNGNVSTPSLSDLRALLSG